MLGLLFFMGLITDKWIVFSRETAATTWIGRDELGNEYNKLFLKSSFNFLNDILKTVGYVSWEKICDTLGIKCDPEDIESTSVIRGKYVEKIVPLYSEPDENGAIKIRITLEYRKGENA